MIKIHIYRQGDHIRHENKQKAEEDCIYIVHLHCTCHQSFPSHFTHWVSWVSVCLYQRCYSYNHSHVRVKQAKQEVSVTLGSLHSEPMGLFFWDYCRK